MTDKKVIIPEDRLAVIRTYLAGAMPEGEQERREWQRCMEILSAPRKEVLPSGMDTVYGGAFSETSGTGKRKEATPHVCAKCGKSLTFCISWLSDDGVCRCSKCSDETDVQTYTAGVSAPTNATPMPDYNPDDVAFPFSKQIDDLAKRVEQGRITDKEKTVQFVNKRIDEALGSAAEELDAAFATHQEQHRVEAVAGKIQSANAEEPHVTKADMGEGVAKAMKLHEVGVGHWPQEVFADMVAKAVTGAIAAHEVQYTHNAKGEENE